MVYNVRVTWCRPTLGELSLDTFISIMMRNRLTVSVQHLSFFPLKKYLLDAVFVAGMQHARRYIVLWPQHLLPLRYVALCLLYADTRRRRGSLCKLHRPSSVASWRWHESRQWMDNCCDCGVHNFICAFAEMISPACSVRLSEEMNYTLILFKTFVQCTLVINRQ